MTNLMILLQAAQTDVPPTFMNKYGSLIMIVAIIAVFYFFMIRPQTKKQKELQKQRDAMKKGDKVITAGGIHGVIKEVNDTTLLIEVSKEVCIKVDKASVYVSAEDVPADNAKK